MGSTLAAVLCLVTLSARPALAHGHMVEPLSRGAEHIRDDTKSWPIAGIKARLRREPCIGLTPNRRFTRIAPGPMDLKLLFPDGANHEGICTASLYDPRNPARSVRIAEPSDCGRSVQRAPGRKGQDVPGRLAVVIPRELPCDPSHCVLKWEWTAKHISRTNIENFEHYDSCADVTVDGGVEIALPPIAGILPPTPQPRPVADTAPGPGLFDQDWTLNLTKSFLHLQSVKNNAIFETHGFEHMEGGITRDGQARVMLDLASFNTGIDLRNVRMQFLFFRTFQFPSAVITAQLDTARLAALSEATSITYPLEFTIELHGITRTLETDVVIARVADSSVSVSVTKPILIPAADFGLLDGIDRLEEVAGVDIAPSASITFHLVFEGDVTNPGIEIIEEEFAVRREAERAGAINAEECANRLNTLSESQAIYFTSGSAEIGSDSAYALDQFADFANRCPDIAITVAGHTDNIGNPGANLRLSQRRADAVLADLVARGLSADRLRAEGFGDRDPVVANDTSANRARNRRIVFNLIRIAGGDTAEAALPYPE